MALDPKPLLHFEANYRWKNKHKNIEATAARLYNAWNRTANGREPARQRWRAGLNALRQIVIEPGRQRGVEIADVAVAIDREEAGRRVVEIVDGVLQLPENIFLALAVSRHVADGP